MQGHRKCKCWLLLRPEKGEQGRVSFLSRPRSSRSSRPSLAGPHAQTRTHRHVWSAPTMVPSRQRHSAALCSGSPDPAGPWLRPGPRSPPLAHPPARRGLPRSPGAAAVLGFTTPLPRRRVQRTAPDHGGGNAGRPRTRRRSAPWAPQHGTTALQPVRQQPPKAVLKHEGAG